MLTGETASAAVPVTDHFTAVIAALSSFGSVGILAVLNHWKGRSRDRGKRSELSTVNSAIETLTTKVDGHARSTTQQIGEIRLELRDLRGFVVGPDGENGIRGDVRELKETVGGLLERERESLQAKAFGALDRRTGT